MQDLTKAGLNLKDHLVEVAAHLRKLKENESKAKLLEIESEEIQNDIDEVQSNIESEKKFWTSHQSTENNILYYQTE